MTTTATLGTCPDCETPVPEHRRLITYEKAGRTAVFAECPGCEDVVEPT